MIKNRLKITVVYVIIIYKCLEEGYSMDKKDIKKRILELSSEIEKHNKNYYIIYNEDGNELSKHIF